MYDIQQCFICCPSVSTVSEDAEIEPRTVATLTLTARRFYHLARSHPPNYLARDIFTLLINSSHFCGTNSSKDPIFALSENNFIGTFWVMRPKSRPVGNTGLKVLLILYEVALLEHGGGVLVGLCRPPLLPLPPHDPVHECKLLFILLLLMLAAIHLYQ